MGRSPTGPEDMVALVAVIAFMATLSRSYASGRQNQYKAVIEFFAHSIGIRSRQRKVQLYPVFAVFSLLFKGYLTFAFFFFVRSEKLAYFDGTFWWDTVHHPYFRSSLAFICAVCANNLADWFTFVFYADKTATVIYFCISGIMVWAFTELALLNRQVSSDHYYLWVGTGLWALSALMTGIAKATTAFAQCCKCCRKCCPNYEQTGFIDDSDYGEVPM